jgi:molybdate transport system substrate-binding protein
MRAFAIAALLVLAAFAAPADAAEIKVLAAGAVRSTVTVLSAEFEARTGNKLVFTFDTAGGLRDKLVAGTPADLIIAPPAVLDTLADQSLLRPGKPAALGAVAIVVAVKTGAPTPDIATPSALKQVLLAAGAVAYGDPATGASSGIYFAKVLQEFGIADAVNAKAKLAPGGAAAAKLVADGSADLVVTQKSEILPVPGVTIVGPLPSSLQSATVYAAAVTKNAAAPTAAGDFIRYISGAEGRAKFKAAGFDPPS